MEIDTAMGRVYETQRMGPGA